MSVLVRRWASLLWWVLPLIVLAGVLAWETEWGRHWDATDPPVETAVGPTRVAGALLPEYRIEGQLAGHSETVNRTLFNPTRRPAPPAPADQNAATMKNGQYVLTCTS